MLKYIFYAYGHKKIKGTHKTTFEITKDAHLTEKGDCIIAVRSTSALMDFPDKIKNAIRSTNAKIKMLLKVDNIVEEIIGFGHPQLQLSHPTDIVCRKSTYICPRTLMINSNKAAKDLSRNLIKKLQNENTKIEITVVVYHI